MTKLHKSVLYPDLNMLTYLQVYGDIWDRNLYEENSRIVSYIYPVIHWLAMAHSVWNPVIYCYMNSRFREGFKAAVSNVPCIWKLVRFCKRPKSRRSRGSGMTTDSARRRMSYYSQTGNTRLTRTNTSCTTYMFGSGSLHNIHNTTAGIHHHQHQNYATNNPLVLRKQSYLLASNGKGSLNARDHHHMRAGSKTYLTSSPLLVSQCPKPTHLNMLSSAAPASASTGGGSAAICILKTQDVHVANGRDGLKQSNTMTSLAPGQSTSMESSPSSAGSSPGDSSAPAAVVPMSCLNQQSSVKGSQFDLKPSANGTNSVANGKKKASLKKVASSGNGISNSSTKSSSLIRNSSSYVTISSKGGKEVVTTSTLAGKKGKSKSTSSSASTPSSTTSNAGARSFLNRKRSSNSSGVSESFM